MRAATNRERHLIERIQYVAERKAAGLSLQDDLYASANDGRFPQAGLKFEYGHISATLFSDRGSTLMSSSFPGSSWIPITIFKEAAKLQACRCKLTHWLFFQPERSFHSSKSLNMSSVFHFDSFLRLFARPAEEVATNP